MNGYIAAVTALLILAIVATWLHLIISNIEAKYGVQYKVGDKVRRKDRTGAEMTVTMLGRGCVMCQHQVGGCDFWFDDSQIEKVKP